MITARRAARAWLGGAALVVFAYLMLARPLPAAVGQPVAYLVQAVTAVVAVSAMARASRRAEGGLRRARLLVAGALAFGAGGGVLAAVLHVSTGRPPTVPSIADAVHLAWVPLVVVALLAYPVLDTRPGSRARSVCEGLVAATALWFVTLTLLVEPAGIGAGEPLLTRLVLLAYPGGDVFVLGVAVSVLGRVPVAARRELALTTGGLAVYIVADLAYFVLEAAGRYRADSWVSVVAELGLVLVLLGALGSAAGRVTAARWSGGLGLLPSVPVLLALVLAVWLVLRGDGLDAAQLLAGTAFVVCVLLRQLVTGRDRDAVTERLAASEATWRALASHDALTGLGNRARARELLSACYATDPPRPATVVLIDLDGFKAVNDTFGHERGDALLVEVGARLRRCLRSGDAVARLGGDEFVLVLDGADDGLAARVLAVVQEPVDIAGVSLRVGASLGLATTADAATPEDLLRNADLAMYASKAAGRNRSTAYAPHMHEAAARRMLLHRGLRDALDEDGLALHYQPIVSLRDGSLMGVEALLRWDDATQGAVSPALFLQVATESGIIGDIDLWVLERACRDIAAWCDEGLQVPRLSINVSPRHLTSDLPELVGDALRRHGLPGHALCLEVTETALGDDHEAAAAALAQVRRLGVQIALDDFGTGRSSLAQLASLPVDVVKVDRSFVAAAAADRGARRVLTSMVRGCQALSLPVVAEGVEDADAALVVSRTGCRLGQGWHYGHPEPGAVFRDRLTGGVRQSDGGTAVADPR